MNKLIVGTIVALALGGTGTGLAIRHFIARIRFTVTKVQYNGRTHKLLLKTKSAKPQALKVIYKGKTLTESTRALKHHRFNVKFRGYGTFKVTNGHLTKKVAAKRYATNKPVLQAAKTPANQRLWEPTLKVPVHSTVTLKFRGKLYHAVSKDQQTKVTLKIPVRTRISDQAFRQETITMTAKQPHKKTSKPVQRKIGLDFPA